MLSLSFPPHKSRDMKPNITHMNPGLILSLQSNSSSFEKTLPSSVHTAHHNQLPRSKTEISQSISQDSRFHSSNRSHQDFTQSNHLSSPSDTGQPRLATQQSTTAANTHSTSNIHIVQNSSAYTSHSNTSSPVMPNLQRGSESSVTISVTPIISSQPLSSTGSSKEISTISIGSSALLSDATVSTQNRYVPYSSTTVSSTLSTTVIPITKSPVSTSVPSLFPVSTVPSLGKIEDKSSYSAPPRLSLSSMDVSLPLKLKKTNNSSSSSSRNGSNTPQFSRNLFESVSGTLTCESISTSKLQQLSDNNSSGSLSRGNTRQTHRSGLFSSVLVSHDSKTDLIVKNTQHKSTDGADKKTAAVISHTYKTDIPNSKPKQTSQDVSTFLSTEVVNLDFSLPPQTCNATSLNIEAKKETTEGAAKDSLSLPDSLQEISSLQGNQQSSSSLSSASHNSFGSYRASDNISTAAGKSEAVSKLSPGVSISSMPSVKEPILEILASALGSTITKASTVSPHKSFVKQFPLCEISLGFEQVEEDVTTKRKMVTIQSGPYRPQYHHSHRQVPMEISQSDSVASQDIDHLTKKAGKKRKILNSEVVAETEVTLVKQPRIHILEPAIMPTSKSPTVDCDHNKVDCDLADCDSTDEVVLLLNSDETESKKVEIDKSQHQSKSSTVANEEAEMTAVATIETAQEDTNKQRLTERSHRLSSSDHKEVNTKGNGQHQSLTSSADSSDESQSNKSSSNESRDSTYRESMLHRSPVISGAESKERRANRISSSTVTVEDKDGHSSKSSAVDHTNKDTFHKGHRLHRGLSDTHDGKNDNIVENRSHHSSSADDKNDCKESPADDINDNKECHSNNSSSADDKNDSKESSSHNSSSADDNIESRSHRSSSADDNIESRSHNSSSADDKNDSKESHSHRSSSADDKNDIDIHLDSSSSADDKSDTNKESRSHRSSSADDKNESRSHSSSSADDKNDNKESRSHRSSSADDKNDNKETRSRRSSSADDKCTTKTGNDISTENPGNSNKEQIGDDGQKKSHRIKRQFYAYVPEKSIDQTYFDTPILTGRTRSKNKPSDLGHDAEQAHDEATQAVMEVESQVQHLIPAEQTVPGKTDGSAENAGNKRPTRSVRVKENPQDHNANKRRRVQQFR